MSIVSIIKCDNYEEEKLKVALASSFENLGGIDKYIKKDMKVFLKPNLIMGKKPERAATTNPVFVKVLCDMLIEKGAKVTIIESPGGPYIKSFLKSIYDITGMYDAARDSGAVLNYDMSLHEINLDKGKIIKKCTIIKPILDADLIINLPKLKTHEMMVYTGAVKNMFGIIAGTNKAEYHLKMSEYNNFANVIIDIFLSCKPGLNILDGIMAMEGNGPTAGDKKEVGLILASENAFDLDRVAVDIINGKCDEMPIVKNSIQRELCFEDINKIDIKGEKIDECIISDFKIPMRDNLKRDNLLENRFYLKVLETLKPKPVLISEKCVLCADCKKSCPAKVITMTKKGPLFDLDKCIRCFCCQELCPEEAIYIKKSLSAKILINTLTKGLDVFLSIKQKIHKRKI